MSEPLRRPDHCSCPKPMGAWGDSGWHLSIATGGPDDPDTRGGNRFTAGTIYAYEKCPAYWAAKAAALSLEMRLQLAGVPDRYVHCRRSGFDGWPEAASTFLRDPETAGILYVYGSNGTGKTHLATAILAELVAEGVTSCKWASAKLVPDQLATSEANEQSYRMARLLVLDDLFSERATPYGAERVRNLLEVRYLNRRPTVITSMLLPEEAIKIDSDLASRACSGLRIHRQGVDRRLVAAGAGR